MEIFENASLSVFMRTDETEVFEYDDLINHKAHAIVFPSFKSFRVDCWRKRFEYNTCGRVDEASK